jgi:hypothetical protein
MISGIGVFYPDKRPTQRIGIIPDEEVKPTIAGIRDGRDEVLEVAIRQILGPNTPAAVIRNMAQAPEVPAPAPANGYQDERSGISWRIPEGWKVRDPLHWGDQQNTVFFVEPSSGSVLTLYFQVLHDLQKLNAQEMDRAMRDDADAKQAQRRREGRTNYTIRPASYVSRKVSGHPALSCIADFDEDGHAMAEYLTFVRTGRLNVILFGNTPAAGSDSFHASFERMIETISIP